MNTKGNNRTQEHFFAYAVSLMDLGKSDQVQELLQEPSNFTELQQVCLQAWIVCHSACTTQELNDDEREALWQHAAEILHSSEELKDVIRAQAYFTRATGTIRRRRPWVLWLLGTLTVYLGSPSGELFSQALSFLNERRMDIPWLRIQILCDQGMLLLSLSSPRAAQAQLQEALRLAVAAKEAFAHEALYTIYIGLCEIHRQNLKDELVLVYGRQALAICPPEQKWEPLFLLGQAQMRLGQREEALVFCREALAFAQNDSQRIECFSVLIRCALQDQNVSEAQRLCDLALALKRHSLLPHMLKDLFRLCGDIALAQAQSTPAPLIAEEFYKKSVDWYCKALSTVPGDLAVSSILTKLLLELVESNGQMAKKAFWRKGYKAVKPSLS